MKFHINDKFLLEGIECYVGHINSSGDAYLVPEEDDRYYNQQKTLKGMVFAVINSRGIDKKTGAKAYGISPLTSGAV